MKTILNAIEAFRQKVGNESFVPTTTTAHTLLFALWHLSCFRCCLRIKKRIDNAYEIRKPRHILGIRIDKTLFVGDALFPAGNDFSAKEYGVVSIQVTDPEETKRFVETIVACLDNSGSQR